MERFKPLLPLGPSTLLEEAIARFYKAGVRDVRVVTGKQALELRPVVERAGARSIFNPHFERGMFSSIQAGIQSLEDDVTSFFLLPVDIPLVRPRTIRTLLEAFNPTEPRILYPRFNGERGHPPLIPRTLIADSVSHDCVGGMRGILDRFENLAIDVDVPDEGILLDCDTPADYRILVDRWAREHAPTETECDALCTLLHVPERVVVHGRMVAEVARLLAVHLNQRGVTFDLPLLVAAGRLHDVARSQPEHAKAGARLLSDLGYPKVGQVVAWHTDLGKPGDTLSEVDLIYLADKYVSEDRLVTLEERFDRSTHRHADRPEISAKVHHRLSDARAIEAEIEAVLGVPPISVLQRYRNGIRTASMTGRRRIFLIRHGAIQSPGDPKRFIGQVDLALNEEGWAQAENLRLALSGIPLTAVYCSDLKRSLQTAELIARDHGLPCIAKPELREISLGEWECLSFDEVRAQFPIEFQARGADIVHCRPPGGESFLDCTCRVLPAFHDILRSTPGNVAIVAHAGVNRILLSQMLGRSLDELLSIKVDSGSLQVIVQTREGFRLDDGGSHCDGSLPKAG